MENKNTHMFLIPRVHTHNDHSVKLSIITIKYDWGDNYSSE